MIFPEKNLQVHLKGTKIKTNAKYSLLNNSLLTDFIIMNYA